MTWRDIKKIVEIADKLTDQCQREGWGEITFYENILTEYNKQ